MIYYPLPLQEQEVMRGRCRISGDLNVASRLSRSVLSLPIHTEMTEEERQDFLYLFFPFLFGVYPYTVVTDKQRRAMDEAGLLYREQTIYEIVYGETRKLLGV